MTALMKQSQIVVRIEPRLKRTFERQCATLGLKPSEALRGLILAFTRLEFRHRILTGEEPLTRDLTVAGFFAMSEEDRSELWEKWHREAEVDARGSEIAVKKIAATRR